MAFPSTPTNGQIAVVGGIAYQYATTPNSWSRILSSANIITANAISVNTLTANTLNVNNNLYNIAGDISATGNVTGNYILGNGSQLTGIASGSSSNISNGTSNITITSSGGNATVNIGGTANVAVFATTGQYVTGVVSASGNVKGGNLLTGGLISATGALTVTGSTFLANVSAGNIDAGTVYSGGNITTNGQISAAGNIITNGQISAAGNVTANNGMFTTIVNVASHTGAVVSVSGNITGGNVVTGGLISATGNVSSGASINTVNLSVSGNVLGNLLPSADITYNLGSPTQRWNTLYLAGNTIELGTQSISATATGVSLGTGDLIGGNVTTTGLISATGNITGGNIRTSGLISATGNVTGNHFVGNGSPLTGIVRIANGTSNVVVTSSGNVSVSLAGQSNAAVFSMTVPTSGSISFNGGFLIAPDNASYAFGTGDFTVEGWLYPTAAPYSGATFIVIGSLSNGIVVGYENTTTWGLASNGGAFIVTSTTLPTQNSWNHFAVTRSAGTAYLFLNGTLLASAASSQNFPSMATFIGHPSPAQTVNGYLSNLRFVKGVAVYTSAFTPPTNALTSTQSANVNGIPSAAITGTSTGLLLNTANGASFLADSSSYNLTITNSGTTSLATAPAWAGFGTLNATYGVFTTSVNTASFTGAVVSVSGNITGGNVTTGGLVNVTGNTTAGNILTGGLISATGNVTANNGMFTTIVNVASHTGAVVSVTGNVTANNGMFTRIVNTASYTGAVVSVTGNITGSYFIGNGSQLTGVTAGAPTSVVNGTSNVVVASSGNVTVGVAGTSNVAVFATTGEYVTGLISATGNITGGNISAAGNLNVTGTTNLGSVSNVKITGGTNGQMLLTDGTGNLSFGSAAANAATINYVTPSKGALITKVGTQSISAATNTIITWTGTVYDTNSFWSSGSNTRITIPAGVTKVKLSASMYGASATDQMQIFFRQNAASIYTSQPEVDSSGVDIPAAVTPVLSVVAGDYFTVLVYSQLARTIGETPEGYNSWVSIEVVEGSVLNTTMASTLTLGSGLLGDVNIVSPANNQSLVYDTATSKWINGLPLTAGTVTTAAQPNITSVGTLTSLAVTGNATANNGMFTNIVNTASYTGAVVSVTGNITGGNVSGTALTGTLATAAQTNITSVGTLGALAVSGNVTAGNVTAGSGVSVPSGSVLFNGTTQVLTVPDNAVFEMSGDFTIEFWFYITATPVGFDTVLSKGAAGVFQPYYFTFNSSTTLLFYSSSSGSSWDVASAVSMGAVSLNTWNTAAVSRSGTAMRLFLNGALATTITNGSALYNNTNAVGIGGRGDVSELFPGYVSTVRIVKGVAVYTSAYTPATAPLSSTQSANQNGNPSAAITGTSTSLLLNTVNGAGFLTDSSTNNFTVTNTGTATSNSLAPFVNTSGTVTATLGVFTGNITGGNVISGGTRVYKWTTQANTAPTGNVPGDNWYDSYADKLYLYINDGTGNQWVDQSFPTSFANLSVTGNIQGGNVTTAGILTVNSGAAATAIVNGAGNAVGNIGSSGTYFNRLFAQATTALYADLAEVYKADAQYPPGTVLIFGGNQEVTISTTGHDVRIAGVVSTNPAHVMNSGLVSEYTVDVGLIGRVPCQVIGPIAVGDRVVSSNQAGVAERLDMQHYQPGVIIGKAVESYNGTGVGTIEIVVGRL